MTRRCALGLAAAIVVTARPADAEEIPSLPQIRQAIVDGDHASARALIGRALAAEVSEAVQAAARELEIVNDGWMGSGRPRASRGTLTESLASESVPWETTFSETRDAFATGDYLELARRFHVLVQRAPDPTTRARAAELRELAKACVPRETVPPPPIVFSEPREASPAPTIRTVWYGWQTLIPDAVAIGAVSAQLTLGRSDIAVLPAIAVSSYLFGGPVVHFFHRRLTTGLADLGIRVGLPLALGGLAAVTQRNATDQAVGAIVGASTGVLIAIPIDALFLARDEVAVESAAASR